MRRSIDRCKRELLAVSMVAVILLGAGATGVFSGGPAAATSPPIGAAATTTTLPQTTVSGGATYATTCTDSLTPNTYAVGFTMTAKALSPVATGQNLVITDQHWQVSIPPTLADDLRQLFGSSVASDVQVTVQGASVAPGSVTSPVIHTSLDLSGAAGTSASGTFDVPDMTFVPTGGTATFALSATVGITTTLTISGTPVVLTCLPTSGGTFLSVDTYGDSAGRFFHSLTPARIIDSRPVPQRVGPLGPWGSGVTQDVTVTGGLSGVPDTATAVVLNLTATGGSVNGDYLSVWPSGAPQPTVSSINFNAGQTIANQVTVKLGEGVHAGKISIFNAGGTTNVLVDVNGYYDPTAGDGFTSLAPARIIDSRPGVGHVGPLNAWVGATTQTVTVPSVLSGVPADADAVVLNVTATGGTVNNNFLSIWPAGAAQPTVSSLNVNAGQTIPNAVTVKLGTGVSNAGQISIFSAGGTQQVIVDVAGYFKAGTGKAFFPFPPARIIDSRPVPQRVGPLGAWSAGATQVVNAGALSSLPSNADSVVLNVTATGGTVNNDYFTIWPTGVARPTVSSLNFDAAVTIANAVTVRLGTGVSNAGRISVFNAGGTVNGIIDIGGYYA